MASILDLSTDPMGPIECIFSKITDIPTIIALESVCKSFRQAALTYCWNTEELSLEFSLKRDVDNGEVDLFQYVNGAPFTRVEGMLTVIDVIISRSKSSIPKLRLTGVDTEYFFQMFLRHLMSKDNQFQEIIFNDVIISNSSDLPTFLISQREIKKFIIKSSSVDGLCRTSENRPNHLMNAIAQLPQLIEFGCIDTDYNADALAKFLRGKSLRSLILDNSCSTTQWTIGIDSILSSLKSLDKLVVTGKRTYFTAVNQVFEVDNVKQVVSGLKELEIWGSPDNKVFCHMFLPSIPTSCPLLKMFTIKAHWRMDSAAGHSIAQHHVMGLRSMAASFLHQNANKAGVKTLLVIWKEVKPGPATLNRFSSLQNQLCSLPGVLESEILGNGRKKIKIRDGSAVLEMIFDDGW